MSNCRSFNRNRKEQSKPKNVANAEISRLALQKINENPAAFIEKLYEIFTRDKKVTAASLIFRLADGYVLPEPKEEGPRKMSLIEKWMREPQWIQEMEAAKKTTEVAESATETAVTATVEATVETATAVESATNTVAGEIGLTPQGANSSANNSIGSAQAGSASGFRPCRNPCSNPARPEPPLPDSFHAPSSGMNSGGEASTSSNGSAFAGNRHGKPEKSSPAFMVVPQWM